MQCGCSSLVSMLPTDLKKLILSFVEVCEDCRKVFIITPYYSILVPKGAGSMKMVTIPSWTDGCCGEY